MDIPLGFGQTGRPPVLVMVAGYSRVITARMLPSRQAADLVSGHWDLLSGWRAVPRELVWDNEAAMDAAGRGGPCSVTSSPRWPGFMPAREQRAGLWRFQAQLPTFRGWAAAEVTLSAGHRERDGVVGGVWQRSTVIRFAGVRVLAPS